MRSFLKPQMADMLMTLSTQHRADQQQLEENQQQLGALQLQVQQLERQLAQLQQQQTATHPTQPDTLWGAPLGSSPQPGAAL
jgi:chromosome segregation ATPase